MHVIPLGIGTHFLAPRDVRDAGLIGDLGAEPSFDCLEVIFFVVI